jgi:hypothetical protein
MQAFSWERSVPAAQACAISPKRREPTLISVEKPHGNWGRSEVMNASCQDHVVWEKIFQMGAGQEG